METAANCVKYLGSRNSYIIADRISSQNKLLLSLDTNMSADVFMYI